MLIFYITWPSLKEAEKAGKYLLEKRLIGCFNIFKIKSGYWWQGKIEKSEEYVLLLKTKKSKVKIIEKEIKKLHSYSIPCIIQIPVRVNKEYEDWLKNEII